MPTARPEAAVQRAPGAGRRPPTRERPASPPRTRPRPAARRPSHRRQARLPAGARRRARTRPLARRAARRRGGGLARARRGRAPSRSRHGRSDARTSAAGRTRGFPRSPADRPPRLPLALRGPRAALLGEGRFARVPPALARAARHAPATVAAGGRPNDRPFVQRFRCLPRSPPPRARARGTASPALRACRSRRRPDPEPAPSLASRSWATAALVSGERRITSAEESVVTVASSSASVQLPREDGSPPRERPPALRAE